jgi:hypothetical protein
MHPDGGHDLISVSVVAALAWNGGMLGVQSQALAKYAKSSDGFA